MVLVVGCTPPGPLSEGERTSPRPSPGGEGVASRALESIDSLMWKEPDSALAVMMEFVASPEADSLNELEGHYCQVLIAELLFKNDYAQSNRTEVLKAVDYFDSIDNAFWRHVRIILKVWATMSATASLRLAPNTSTPCGSWKAILPRMS